MRVCTNASFSVLLRIGSLVGWYSGRIMGDGNGGKASDSDVVL